MRTILILLQLRGESCLCFSLEAKGCSEYRMQMPKVKSVSTSILVTPFLSGRHLLLSNVNAIKNASSVTPFMRAVLERTSTSSSNCRGASAPSRAVSKDKGHE